MLHFKSESEIWTVTTGSQLSRKIKARFPKFKDNNVLKCIEIVQQREQEPFNSTFITYRDFFLVQEDGCYSIKMFAFGESKVVAKLLPNSKNDPYLISIVPIGTAF
jgi:hypothetical protein